MKNSKITELEAELERLTRLVYFDELTGVRNRRGFLEEAGRIFHSILGGGATPERRGAPTVPFSIIFIDLDNFKALNDTSGHAAGDEALQAVATTIRAHLRTGDVFGRLGGEEFVVALVNVSAEHAAATAEKLRAQIAQSTPVTASLGVAEYRGEQDIRDLIERADQAMYQAKQGGKNRVAVSA